MMIVVLATGVLYLSAIWIPRILVALVAAFIAVMLAKKARRLAQSMLAHPLRHLDYDEKPSRTQRRLMRASLRVARTRPSSEASFRLWSLAPITFWRAELIASSPSIDGVISISRRPSPRNQLSSPSEATMIPLAQRFASTLNQRL